MNIFIKIFGVFVFSSALLVADDGILNAPKTQSDSVLASVNGEAIILSDILPYTRAREYEAYAAYSGERLAKVVYDLRMKAVNDLIDRKLIIADYRKQNFTISQNDIEFEIDRISEQMGCRSREEFRRRLRSSGEDPQVVRMEIEERLIVQYMSMRRVKISGDLTPKEVYEYFIAHENEYAGVERIGLDMLRLETKRENLKQEMKEISEILKRSPERFSELVRRYAPESGDGWLGEIERKKLRPEFAAVLIDLNLGKVYGPLTLEDGVFWLKIRSYEKPQKKDFLAVEGKIRAALMSEKREKALKEYTSWLRSRAVIEYRF